MSYLQALLLFLLVYSPWYGADHPGQRILVPGLRSWGISLPGLYNFIYIALAVAALIPLLGKTWLRRRPTWLEMAIMAYVLFAWLHINVIDKDYFLSMENSLFLGVLVLAILNRETLASYLPDYARISTYGLGFSLFLAIALPPFFVYPYQVYGDYPRYVGWLGSAAYIGFLGMALCIWAGHFLRRYSARGQRILGFAFLLLGLVAIYLALSRIGMACTVLAFLIMSGQALRAKSKRLALFYLLVSITGSVLLFSGPMASKSGFLDDHITAPSEDLTAFPLLNALANILQTNGRISTINLLLGYTKGHSLWGFGAGEASRFLRRIHHVFAGQPHNDYLRTYVDHGLVGLFALLALGLCVAYQLRNSYALAPLAAFALCMLTDNLFVSPVCGSGPLLLAGLLFDEVRRNHSRGQS